MSSSVAFCSHRSLATGAVPPTPGKTLLMLKILAFTGFFALAAVPALAQDTKPAPTPDTTGAPTQTQRVFKITRNGDKIGTTDIEIDKDGDKTVIKSKTKISVEVMFIQAYHYNSIGTEVWQGGKFVSFHSHTDDNGKKHSVSEVSADGDTFNLVVDGKKTVLDHFILPGTLFSNDFIGQTQLIDPDKGTIMSIEVKDLGQSKLAHEDAPVQHYKITGDFPRDVWLEGDEPVRIKLMGSDHSKIVMNLEKQ
jgi:Cu/Zn superoxide dismutase